MKPRVAVPPLPTWALALYLGLLLVGGSLWLLLNGRAGSPDDEAPKVVLIKPYTSSFGIATALKEAGVIRSRLGFLAVAIVQGSHRRLLPGEYEFDRQISVLEVIRRLEQGRGLVRQVTIPEGLAAQQIAQLLAEQEFIDRDRFMRLLRDQSILGGHGVEGETLEGYLFPDTYRLVKGHSEEAIIHRMVRRFREVFGPDEQARAGQLGMSVRDVVTMASLIEREAKVPDERPLISAVFHNRLRVGMPLQSDPTVLYALSRFSGRLTKANLQAPSPYNTYRNNGLPPGPIANPGRASIMAALHPAATRYLYFVSRNDGTHAFSKTLREHEGLVRRYQVRGGG